MISSARCLERAPSASALSASASTWSAPVSSTPSASASAAASSGESGEVSEPATAPTAAPTPAPTAGNQGPARATSSPVSTSSRPSGIRVRKQRAAAAARASRARPRAGATRASSAIERLLRRRGSCEWQCAACDDEIGLPGCVRPGGVDAAEQVAVATRELVGGDDAEPDFVADRDRRAWACGGGGRRRRGLALDRLGVEHDERVRDPERQAIDDQTRAGLDAADRLRELERLLDRLPRPGPFVAVTLDPCRHLHVVCPGGAEEDDRCGLRRGEPHRQLRLAGTGAAEQKHEHLPGQLRERLDKQPVFRAAEDGDSQVALVEAWKGSTGT